MSLANKKHMGMKKLINSDEMGMFLFLTVICIFIGVINPSFFSFTNVVNLLRAMSLTVIPAIGLTFVLIAGNIDLSLGSVIGLGGMITGLLLVMGLPIPIAILAGIMAGAVFGFFNGYIITKFQIPALIVTLGSLYIARGAVNILSQGQSIYPFPEGFMYLGSSDGFLNIPISVWITVGLCLVAHYVLKYTTYGRSIYAIGGNKETARVSGILVERIILISYVVLGMMSAFSGIVMASKVNSSIANAGTGWELKVMAAVIIGGTSMFGGVGSILGTLIGSAVMTVLSNGMVMLRISAFWQNVVVGLIIIIAVGMDQYKRKNMQDKKENAAKENVAGK